MTKRMTIPAMSGAAIAAALAVAFLLGIPGHLAASIVAERLEAASRHHVHIAGEIGVGLWPRLTFTAANVHYSDGGDLFKTLDMEAQSLEISVEWSNLLTATPRVTSVELVRPVARVPLVRNRRGDQPDGRPSAQVALAAWLGGGSFERLSLTDGTLTLLDANSGATSRLDHVDIAFSPSLPGQHFDFDGEAVWNGQRLSLQARIAGDALRGGDPGLKLDFLLEAPGLAPTVSGVAQTRFVEDRLTITDLKGLVGINRITGDVGIDFAGVKPLVRGAFASERFDAAGPFDSAPARHATAVASDRAAAAWSDRDWHLEALNYVDADLSLRFGTFGIGALRLAPAGVEAKLSDGLAMVALESDAGRKGRMAAELSLDVAGAWPIYHLRAAAEWPSILSFVPRIDGRGAVNVDVGASGASLRGVMASVAGTASIDLRDALIHRSDLLRDFHPLAARLVSGRRVETGEGVSIERLSAHFRLDHGQAVTEDLHLTSPVLDLDGSGKIDLSGRRLDLRLDPKVVGRSETSIDAAEAAGFDQPFHLEGPWSAARVGPDIADGPALRGSDRAVDLSAAVRLQPIDLRESVPTR